MAVSRIYFLQLLYDRNQNSEGEGTYVLNQPPTIHIEKGKGYFMVLLQNHTQKYDIDTLAFFKIYRRNKSLLIIIGCAIERKWRREGVSRSQMVSWGKLDCKKSRQDNAANQIYLGKSISV